MKLKDTLVLVSSKLKIRKTRTIVTIITASVLYGVIMTVLFVASGLFGNMAKTARTNLENPILSYDYPNPSLDTPEVQAEAIRLYNESTDPNKEYPVWTPSPLYDIDGSILQEYPQTLVDDNPFAEAAIAPRKAKLDQTAKDELTKLASRHQGKVISIIDYYRVIDSAPTNDPQDVLNTNALRTAASLTDTSDNTLAPLIKIKEQKDDVIQILLPLDHAANLLGINPPRWTTPNSAEALQNYVRTVNEQAIGHEFTNPADITFQIVGLLPSQGIDTLTGTTGAPTTIRPDYGLNLIEAIVSTLQYGTYNRYNFIVTNPNSTAFQSAYDISFQKDYYSTPIVIAFDDIESAAAFEASMGEICFAIEGQPDCRRSYPAEIASNQLQIHSTANTIDISIGAFALVFTIVAAIIMAGTVSRVVSDERQTIALYRAVGASTKNILQVFSVYILVLCLLIIICSTIVGLILSGIITATNTANITANVAAMHNIPDLAPLIFIGFDYRILLIYIAILAIGALCLLLVIGKLTSKNIVKDLRKA